MPATAVAGHGSDTLCQRWALPIDAGPLAPHRCSCGIGNVIEVDQHLVAPGGIPRSSHHGRGSCLMFASAACAPPPHMLAFQKMRARASSNHFFKRQKLAIHLKTAARNTLRGSDRRPRRHGWSFLLPNPTAATNARADTNTTAVILLLARLPRAAPASGTVMRSLLAR